MPRVRTVGTPWHARALQEVVCLLSRQARGSAASLCAAVALASGCGSDGAPAAPSSSVHHLLLPTSPSAAEPAQSSSSGLRFGLEVSPSDPASLDVGLDLARRRLDSVLPRGVEAAVYRHDGKVWVELGPASNEVVAEVRSALVADGSLRVARCDGPDDPLRASLGEVLPAGVELERELLGASSSGAERVYARTPQEPSAAAARMRLEAFLSSVAPSARFALGSAEVQLGRAPRRFLRSYLLAEEPERLHLADVLIDDDTGFGAPPALRVRLTSASSARFAELTGSSRGQRLAILVGSEVLLAPVVMSRIDGGELVLSLGSGSRPEERFELARRLRLGGSDVRLHLAVEEVFRAHRPSAP